MGNFNCCHENKYNMEENNKIYQINREKNPEKEKLSENNNFNNKNKYELFSYDTEENLLVKYYIKIPILTSLKGISELNFKSKLYLCGTSSLDIDSSSYLFQINCQNLSTKIMVNSKYSHYYPSLIAINTDKIVCIGGKKNVECEIYDIVIDHWSSIPNLPEERYKSTLCYDYKHKFLYLFGGINTKGKNKNIKFIEKDNILRISSRNYAFPIWEKIFIENKTENNFLNRISSACIFLGDNKIIIIGGKNEQGKKIKNISKYDINKSCLESSGNQLEFPAKFINQNIFVDYGRNCFDEKNFFYLFDSDNNIHILKKQQYISNFYEDELQLNIMNNNK